MTRSPISKKTRWVLVLAAVCSVLTLFCLCLAPTGTEVVVECRGEELWRQPLSELTEPITREFTGADGIVVTVQVSAQGAAVVSSQCPDKVCVHTGTLTKAGQSAICLPAQFVLRLEGNRAVDAAA